jgi:hypothetical protein
MNIAAEIKKIWETLQNHEDRFANQNLIRLFRSLIKEKDRLALQQDYYKSLQLALCIDTRDPLKQNRVSYFSPVLHIPIDGGGWQTASGPEESGGQVFTTRVDQLPWAYPISPLGGFDDSGCSWVPPPGSLLCLIFQNGDPNSAFYIGTTWFRDRGKENELNFNYIVPEYDKIFKTHRKGYMVGKNDESQVLPPNNTSNYQGYDVDSSVDIDVIPDADTKTTYPHEYTLAKTPEKHRITLDDGDPRCNRRYKRMEFQSSLGNYLLMKDDPYHYSGEWVNPNCSEDYVSIIPSVCFPSLVSYIDIFDPSIISYDVLPYSCEQGPENCPTLETEGFTTPVEVEYLGNEYLCPSFSPPPTSLTIPNDCIGVIERSSEHCLKFNNAGKNKYQKNKQDCFPFLGSRVALQQSGIQALSRSGATLVLDDSVEEPRGKPNWEQAMQPFDFDGCTGVFKGQTYLASATDHVIRLSDEEISPKVRGPGNGIDIKTACGNEICMSDHTLPDGVAGDGRGIHIKSTADHSMDFVDAGNRQASPERSGCAKTGPWANRAFVRLKTGYGISVMLNDGNDQKKTDGQYFQIKCPQKDNAQRGFHTLMMQEKPNGPGQIYLRAGGNLIVQSYDTMTTTVGLNGNIADSIEYVSGKKVVNVKDVYYNRSKTHVFWSDDHIFLAAGKDGEDANGNPAPTVYPVLVATQPIPENFAAMLGIKASEHVFASAGVVPDHPCDNS